MKLIFSTSDFKISGVPFPGFPILLDALMNIQWHALSFLIYVCTQAGQAYSLSTWEQYGRALYDYFGYCEANGHDWKVTNSTSKHSTIEKYRNWSMAECGLEPSTVNDRLRIIYRFYQYALEQCWIQSLPLMGKKELLKDYKPGLIKKDTTGGNKNFSSGRKASITTFRILSRTQIDTMFGFITNTELKLITRLGLACGLRKQEMLTFPTKYIVDPNDYPSTKMNYRVTLNPREMKTKGNKIRQIDIPASLMRDLWSYIKYDRQVRFSLCSSEKDKKLLFLTEHGKRFSNGGRGLNKLYKELALPFKLNPHILRHTYATHTLYVLTKMNLPMVPLIYLRDRLGHSSIKTTEIYLHFIELVDDSVLDTMQNNLAEYYAEVANETSQEL